MRGGDDMDNKCLSFIVGSLLILPIVGVGVVAGVTKISQVHAQEIAYNVPASHLSHMANMMDSDSKKQMIEMMKKHHGAEWQKECNTMDSMKMSS